MSQLQLSTGLLAFTSEVIALIVLISMTISMCNEAKTLAKDSLESQIYENTEVTAYQTALVIDRELRIIVDSITLALSRGLEFSHEYDINSHIHAETTFFDDQMPLQSDFPQTSRLDEQDISFLTDSIYLIEVTYDSSTPNVDYVSADGQTWIVHDSSFSDPGTEIQAFFDRSSHLTRLMKFAHAQWSSVAAIYIGTDFGNFACPYGYSTSTCTNGDYMYENSHYRSFRRYPGRNATSISYINYTNADKTKVPYDPTLRGWFIGANTTTYEYHLDGPYTDATTGDWMITFSKKEKTTDTSPLSVIGIDVLLSDLQTIITGLTIGANGFGILLLYSPSAITTCASDGGTCTCSNGLVRFGNALAWSDWKRPSADSIDCKAANFDVSSSGNSRVCECEPEPFVLAYGSSAITQETKLSDIDVDLLNSDYTLLRANAEKGSFSYVKADKSYVGGFGKALDGSMVVLTIAPESEALQVVEVLEDDISKTQASISTIVILCTIAALVISLIFVHRSSQNISQPLVDIAANCKIIMDAQTKENKTFQPHAITVFGFDSLFDLANAFVTLMKGMHDTEARKQAEPKYPKNEFWVGNQNLDAPWRVHPISRYQAPMHM